jgi:hypothetical protein
MTAPPKTDRAILVFAIWAVLGFLGLGFMLEGIARDSYLVAVAGIGLIVASFVVHIIVNAVFNQGFTPGETALGIGVFGVLAAVFITSWLARGLSMADFYAGLTLFGALALGFLAYLMTRYGLRGAFSHFHLKPASFEDSK